MRIAVILALTIVLTGCGKMFFSERDIYFDANVEDVLVTINGETCLTPCTLPVKSHKGILKVRGEKEGYKSVNKSLQSSISPAIALDVVGGVMLVGAGITSTVVDAAGDGLFWFSPNKPPRRA